MRKENFLKHILRKTEHFIAGILKQLTKETKSNPKVHSHKNHLSSQRPTIQINLQKMTGEDKAIEMYEQVVSNMFAHRPITTQNNAETGVSKPTCIACQKQTLYTKNTSRSDRN